MDVSKCLQFGESKQADQSEVEWIQNSSGDLRKFLNPDRYLYQITCVIYSFYQFSEVVKLSGIKMNRLFLVTASVTVWLYAPFNLFRVFHYYH